MTQLSVLRVQDNKLGSGYKIASYFNAEQCTVKDSNGITFSPSSLVLNWGRSYLPKWWSDAESKGAKLFNHPLAVARCADKVRTLARLNVAGVNTLQYTTDRDVAQSWLQEGLDIVIRHKIKSCAGKGIEIVFSKDIDKDYTLPQAPLYTVYIHKEDEFRVHVFQGEVIDYIQKKRMGKAKREKRGLKEANELIRTHDNGWVFARENIAMHPSVYEESFKAVVALGLDFGAVDIMVCPHLGPEQPSEAIVLEVNSAPGLEDKNTFQAYVGAIDKLTKDDRPRFISADPTGCSTIEELDNMLKYGTRTPTTLVYEKIPKLKGKKCTLDLAALQAVFEEEEDDAEADF